MEKYPKLFILASIGYLLLGVLMGLHIGMAADKPYIFRFIHVHLNLLGFMSMFIYGVAYHILPRFNASPLKHPGTVAVHFYLVNIGLIGIVVFASLDGLGGEGIPQAGFIASSLLEAAGIFLFAYNIIPVMLPEKEEEEAPAIDGSDNVPGILGNWPGLADIFNEHGLKAIITPEAMASFAKSVTISQACKIHKVDETAFLAKLNEGVKSGSAGNAPKIKSGPSPEKKAADTMAKGKKIARGELCESETLIGSLIEVYPETKPVFEKHYGEGCFTCPGQAFETLEQTATMHGIKTKKILDEVNAIISSVNNG